ncbi:hypothetical protein [Francisella philomiragia]|uniref:hypothetical protein n=1 Tax=Francisella philomiragia TaxID=28110 RepID=UPI003517A769
MLIKTIHLDKNFEATNPNDKDYKLSIDTVLTDLDSEGAIGLFVELDSIYQYAFGKKQGRELLGDDEIQQEATKINTLHYRNININGFQKYFIDIELLSSYLMETIYISDEADHSKEKLKFAYYSIPFAIITEWNSQAYKLKKAIAELDITIANTFDNSKDIFNLLSYFSNRVS